MTSIRRVLGAVRRVTAPERATRRIIRHNRRVWRPTPLRRGGPEVLMDGFNIAQSTLAYSYLANVLQETHQARLKVFGIRPLTRNLDMYRVFRSFGVRGYVHARTSRKEAHRHQDHARELLATIDSKRNLFELVVDGVGLGQDVYESYLRRFSAATVHLEDPRLTDLLAETLGYLRFWQRHLATHDVRALMVSHDCYVENNILCKLAYQRGVPTYMPHIHRVVRMDRPHSPFLVFPRYRELFSALPEEAQRDGLALAESRLQRRLGGESGVDITFTERTAFSLPDTGSRVLADSERLKVLICTHCFFDNPHVFGGMLFEDFWEWLAHLGRFAETTDHEWYLKTHPDPLPGTSELIDELLARHPRLTLLPSTVSHHQLVAEGIDVVLTCYGSVGEEYPLLGVPVLTAGYNPRAAYEFNRHVGSLAEYDEQLRHLGDLVGMPMEPTDVYEFYFMHHLYSYADDLILDSFDEFAQTPVDTAGTAVYDHFLDRWSPEKHERTVRRLREFVASGARYLYRFGPTGTLDEPPAPRS